MFIGANKNQIFLNIQCYFFKPKGAHSVELLKSYCLPFIVYATEVISLSKSTINMLDNCVHVALYRIFGVSSSNVVNLRQYLDLPMLQDIIERRRVKFMDTLQLLPDFRTVLQVLVSMPY
jgi:hypothetical protein